ncbi:hypothetical protein [Nocardioides aequoreus]|uniref:hypothetical protein n=1 Tax=Nocardioides aequoreus TaxID=397278 RepID=UPI0004C34999|nr:hypothetical protein [Nocardioides aequoreus]
MSDKPGEAPEPTVDAEPDFAPGGPADRIDRDEDDFPLTTPDQPRSAQVEEDVVPDEIEESDETDAGTGDEDGVDPSQEDPV